MRRTGQQTMEGAPMGQREIDAIRTLLTSKPRPVGWDERRPRIEEAGATRPIAHATAATALRAYSARRDAHVDPPRSPYFFVAEEGGRLLHQYVHRVFWRLSRQIGLRRKGQRNGPRVHDLRHRFAVTTLLRWYRAGEDIKPQLPVLSTFLGHVSVRDTYWYLSATPELMSHAAQRLDKRWETRS